MDTKTVGNLGEDLACEYLVEKGFKIIGRNYRIPFGEIDIIVRKKWGWFTHNRTIHFVEVKTLSYLNPELVEGFFPEQRVDYKKQEKLKKLAELWLTAHKFPENHPYQIDIVAVSIEGNAREVQFFENVVAG